MTSELKPCPWEKPGEKHEVSINRITVMNPATGKGELLCAEVECQYCGATQRGFDTEEEAVSAWNDRAERTCTMVPSECVEGYALSDQEEAYRCSKCGTTVYATDPSEVKFCIECGAKVAI